MTHPVLVITGPVGVGKSTVLAECNVLLVEVGARQASLELEDIARYWPPDGADKSELIVRNLAALWTNYSAAGADRLIVSMLLEDRKGLAPIYVAIPGAEVTIIQLEAPLDLLEWRVRRRELTQPEAEVSGARWWFERLRGATFADHRVENAKRPPREVAADVLRLAGWL